MKQRLFIGIELPANHKNILDKYTDSLIKNIPQLKKEQAEKLHVTLKFLGTIGVPAEKILSSLQSKLINQGSFAVEISKPVVFINTSTLLVIEIAKNEELLRTFHKINNELESLGFPRDKRNFYPHITLARSKKILVTIPKIDQTFNFPSFSVSKITLFASKTTRTGSVYTTLGEIQLAHM